MLKQLTYVQVWVHDQDEALAFYTEKLGWEVRSDVTMPEMGNFRWLTVGPASQPDFSVGLSSLGSFTTSFTRTYGISPTAYRASFPPAADRAMVPACVVHFYGRPKRRTFREDKAAAPE